MSSDPGSPAGPPFRAEHVGSLLRPAELRQAHRALTEGRTSLEELREIQDRCIRDAIRLQEDAGLESITDGEFRRASYWSTFVDAVAGMTVRPARFVFHDNNGDSTKFLAPHTEARLARERSIAGEELDFLQAATGRTPKITLPSPPTMHFWRGSAGIDSRAYKDREQFFEDLAGVYRTEIEDLARRGACYVQLDEVPLAMLCDPDVRSRIHAEGESAEELISRYLALIDDSIPDNQPQLTIGMHLCRGNYKGRWLSQGGYDAIAERLFNETRVDVFLLEYDTERAGDFVPLHHLPAGKRVHLGLVSTKTPAMESKADLCRSIEAAASYTDLGRLGLCTQCGFASTVGGNPLTIDDQRRKLSLVCEVAREVWGD